MRYKKGGSKPPWLVVSKRIWKKWIERWRLPTRDARNWFIRLHKSSQDKQSRYGNQRRRLICASFRLHSQIRFPYRPIAHLSCFPLIELQREIRITRMSVECVVNAKIRLFVECHNSNHAPQIKPHNTDWLDNVYRFKYVFFCSSLFRSIVRSVAALFHSFGRLLLLTACFFFISVFFPPALNK